MKKFLMILILICTFAIFNVQGITIPKVSDHKKVTIYMFRRAGCSHCHEAIEYFYEFVEDHPEVTNIIDFKLYEVLYNSSNSELFKRVAEEFEQEVSGVPYIVIGDVYYEAGFAESMGEKILQTAFDEYENDNYNDVVANIRKSFNNTVVEEFLEHAAMSEGIIDDDLYNDDLYDDTLDIAEPILDVDDVQEELRNTISTVFNTSVASIIIFILLGVNFVLLITSIVFIVLYIKEKKNHKKNTL